MPPGFARTAVAEEAVRAADAANDLDAGYEARMALAEAAQHGGEPHKALVAVTWCLGQIDAHPGRFDTHGPYWALKWLPHTLLDLPEVPLDEVERVLGEMRRRYEAAGTGQDAVAKLAWTIPLRVGRIAEAVEAHRRWRLIPRTEYGDCRACDVHSEVLLALAVDDSARALDLARPVLAGRLDCAEEPARILGTLLAPVSELGRPDEAERFHTWGLRLARGNPSLVMTQAEHVMHLLRTGRLDEALALLAEIVDVVDRGLFDVDSRLWVAAAGGSVTAALAERGIDRVTRPIGDRPRETGTLARTFASEARATATAFDQRNGTDALTRKVEAWLAVRPQPSPAAHVPGTPVDVVSPAAPSAHPEPAATDPTDLADPAVLLDRARKAVGLKDDARLALAERALSGFIAAHDPLGVARARRSIGAALMRIDRDDEGADILESVIDELADEPTEQGYAALDLARLAFGRAERIDDDVRRWLHVARDAAERSTKRDAELGLCLAIEAEWHVLELGVDPDATVLGKALGGFATARSLLRDVPEELAHSWAAEASSRACVGDVDGSLAPAATAWQLATELDNHEVLATVGELYAQLLTATGHPQQALDVLTAMQRAELAGDDRLGAAQTALARVDVLRDLEREEEALAVAWEAADLFAAAGDSSGAADARLTVARLFRALGQDLNAYDMLSELVAQAADDGDRRLEGAVAVDLALLNLEYGDVDEGMASAQRALTCFDPDDAAARGRAYRVLADLHLARDEMELAVAAGEEAMTALCAEGDPVLTADVQREQAHRLVVAGHPTAALDLYGAAREGFAASGLSVQVAAVDLGRADALAALGRADEAVALAEEVAEVGLREDVPELQADALWAAAAHAVPDDERYDRALDAYAKAGAPPEQLEELRSRRDAALGRSVRRPRWRS
ncbi:hypothetical protein GCM10010531_43300 [Blastococcus jejuensis]|uniref:Tetratricopeptide repeat-containing protein n=1 Tax=Blastococcus jejuensis TaxID=351224 RepID=A0ABP6PNE0_9ACTN